MDINVIDKKRNKEKEIVQLMIGLYCNGNHCTKKDELCNECKDLNQYANQRIDNCPNMMTKTFCSKCKTHCYNKEMREKIKAVMRFSGPRMIFYHPIIAIKHLIEN